MAGGFCRAASRLYACGEFEAALEEWERQLGVDPVSLQALCGKASCLAALQRLDEAENLYLISISLHSESVDPVYGLASIYVQRDDLEGAVALYRAFLSKNPASSESFTALVLLYRRLGDSVSASSALQSLIDLEIDRADAHCDLGFLLQDEGRFEEALVCCQRALRLRPDYPEAMNNMGVTLERLGRFDEAFEWYSKALKLRPGFADVRSNLGAIYHLRGDLEAAASLYWASVSLAPSSFHAFHNLGLNCIARGEIITALASYTRSLAIAPDCLDERWSRSLCLLLLGRYTPAWNDHEVRLVRKNGAKLYATTALPRWGAQSLGHADRLLVISEQGLGDTIQFMRYLPLLTERGISVQICAHPSLHRLIRASGLHPNPLSPAQVDSIQDGLWIPLLSLPMQLGITPAKPGPSAPYLQPDPAEVAKWSECLARDDRLLVALNWQGNPESEITNLKGRSLPLEAFAPLADRPDLIFVSMQKGHGAGQLSQCSFGDRFVPCQQLVDDTWDFQETLAILANCDLLITSDTSMAHLAGAMGMPTWLLLQQVPDWRWGLDGESTFWYPSMRLFRQKERGNWNEVMHRVGKALADLEPSPVLPAESSVRQQTRAPAGPKAWLSSFWNWVEAAGELVPASLSVESSSDLQKSSLEKARAFSQEGSLVEAREACIDAICYGPDEISSYCLLGVIERRLGHLDRACEAFRGALCLDPYHLLSHCQLLSCLFRRDEFAQIWQELERGVQFVPGSSLLAVPDGVRWHSTALPAGREVLVVFPISLSESIQWLRCLPALINAAAQVHLCSPAPLRGLLADMGLPVTFCTPEQAEIFQGPWLPLLGLPGRLSLDPGTLSRSTPYLHHRPDRQQTLLESRPSGIDPLLAVDPALSTPYRDFLADVQRFQLVVLPGLAQDTGLSQISETDGVTDLRDLASILVDIDLVITSDGPLAHLSAALGRPTWLLLNSEPEWRWGHEGEATPWYPSIRIFRQGSDQSLNSLFEHLRQALHGFRQSFSA